MMRRQMRSAECGMRSELQLPLFRIPYSAFRTAFCLAGIACISLCPKIAIAQAAWEYTPYQIRVWIALDAVPQLPQSLVSSLAESLPARTNTVLGAVVQTQLSGAPAKLRGGMLRDLDGLAAHDGGNRGLPGG